LTRGLEVIHSRDDDFVLRGLAYSVFGGDINSTRARFNRGDVGTGRPMNGMLRMRAWRRANA
jgi:hypothetical protein